MSRTNLCHLAKFFKVSSDEVEEGQLVKVLCSLVRHFYHLIKMYMNKANHIKTMLKVTNALQ